MTRPAIIRSDDLRNENRLRLLSCIRASGPCTTTRINTLTGLSAAAISTLSGEMADDGILHSARYQEPGKMRRGRPRRLLSLRPDAGHVIALTLTIDLIRAHLVDYAGRIIGTRETTIDTRSLSKRALLQQVQRQLDALLSEHKDIHLRHIGVGFQGQTEHATGALLWSPVIREWNVPLGERLQQRYGVAVSVHNDCRLMAEALINRHADVLGDTFAAVLFGHGIGLGLYLNGRPFSGTRSSAMEIGHLRFRHDGALCRCGKRGCIEAYAADYGIERLATGLPAATSPAGRVARETMHALYAAAEDGQPQARAAFTIAGQAIGEGLSTVFTLLDPIPVALVGCPGRAYELMREGICDVLDSLLVNGDSVDSLLHRFEVDDALLVHGLIDNSLGRLDRLLAIRHDDNEVCR